MGKIWFHSLASQRGMGGGEDSQWKVDYHQKSIPYERDPVTENLQILKTPSFKTSPWKHFHVVARSLPPRVTWLQSPRQLARFILGDWVTSPKFCSYRLSVKRKKKKNLELKHPQGNEPKHSGKFTLCGEDKITLPTKPVSLRKYTGPQVLWRQGGEHIFLPA